MSLAFRCDFLTPATIYKLYLRRFIILPLRAQIKTNHIVDLRLASGELEWRISKKKSIIFSVQKSSYPIGQYSFKLAR